MTVKKPGNPLVAKVVEIAIGAVIGALISTPVTIVTVTWKVRGTLDEVNTALALLRSESDRTKQEIVGRREHDAKWDDTAHQMIEVKAAINDVKLQLSQQRTENNDRFRDLDKGIRDVLTLMTKEARHQ